MKSFHWEKLAVLTDRRESDCYSFFCFANHMPEEVCAPPHDTFCEDIACFVVFQNLAPNSADDVPLSTAADLPLPACLPFILSPSLLQHHKVLP